ncbi:MAG: recombinase family protein [Hungatella sp.]|nr:recombinase family protein [Hungatella sp.]
MPKKRVVFYGRVSTQSEEQISALGNQMTWYEQLLLIHPEWVMVGTYEDAGVTGTNIRKRKGFQQMLEDGIQFHQYDLIVTRETKRFARNTVDALSYVRLLKQNGIEVYFVNDGIHTISDNDGELRLSIMATIAQEESRKTSENVKAGQRISRQKGILRGTGNILGYKRIGKSQYEIEPEQALIVKKIYQWYLDGDGIRVIKRKLEEQGYPTATGKKQWQFQVIDNILKNPFYIGKQRQLSMISDGYLSQKRIKNSPDKIEYIQGNYEPIISEEIFEEARRIRESRYEPISHRAKKDRVSIWCGKYLCGCGCGTVRRSASRGEYTFLCCWQHTNGNRKRTLTEKGPFVCTLKTIMEWKLDMIAYYVINDIWNSKKKDIAQALKIIAECYKEKGVWNLAEYEVIKNKISKLEKRQKNLLDMRVDGEITKEEYTGKRTEYECEINKLYRFLAEVKANGFAPTDDCRKLDNIKSALEQILDLSKPKLNRELIDGVIWKIIHISDQEFELYLKIEKEQLGLRGASMEKRIVRYKVFEYPEPEKEKEILCTRLKSIKLTYEDAAFYRTMSTKQVMKKKWADIVVHIYCCSYTTAEILW